jgi:predicted MFS family arabinose efflux permease
MQIYSETEFDEGVERAGEPAAANWAAVVSLSLSVIGFIVAEMLPASLLTPIAADLHVTDGMAGQAVTTTSLVALFASLFMAAATRRFDRRSVLLSFAGLLVASNLLVALATDYPTFLVGRVLLGIGLGGFWSMSAAVSIRLVPAALVPRALSIIFGGVSIGLVAGIPLGTYLGTVIGWRGLFLGTTVMGAAAFIWQLIVLPSISPSGQARLSTLFEVLKRPQIGVGKIGMMCVFAGHFIFFTYLRAFLEIITGVNANGVAMVLLGFGVANILGTALSGAIIRRGLRFALASTPLLMAFLAAGLVGFGGSVILAATFVAAWGFAFGVVPVSWTTWITRTVPDETESAGGLQVAAIQAAIAGGAGFGGLLLDVTGPRGAMMGGSVVLFVATAVILVGLKPVEASSGDRAVFIH